MRWTERKVQNDYLISVGDTCHFGLMPLIFCGPSNKKALCYDGDDEGGNVAVRERMFKSSECNVVRISCSLPESV